MENMVELVLNAENVRMLVLLVFGFCGYVLIKSQMKGLEYSLNLRIDCVEASLNKKIDGVESSLLKAMDEKIAFANQNLYTQLYTQLKNNDFRHLNDTVEALTFMLEKNKFLTREDKEYIDGRLDK
jgi:hypothetical protein